MDKKTLQELNNKIDAATEEREAALKEFRAACPHLYLMEDDMARPPMRICVDCGAEERGWYCGYQVLTLIDEFRGGPKVARGIVTQKGRWTDYRLRGRMYEVGQSHSAFQGGGPRTYAELTAQEQKWTNQ